MIITQGRSGSLLVRKDGSALSIPSVREGKVADPTGAGDIFVGSWLATFLALKDPSWAGAVGAAVQPGHLRLVPVAAAGDLLGRPVLHGRRHALPDAARGGPVAVGDGRAVRRRAAAGRRGVVLDVGTH